MRSEYLKGIDEVVFFFSRALKSLFIFLLEQPSQLKYIEWPSFQSTVSISQLKIANTYTSIFYNRGKRGPFFLLGGLKGSLRSPIGFIQATTRCTIVDIHFFYVLDAFDMHVLLSLMHFSMGGRAHMPDHEMGGHAYVLKSH